MDLSSMLNDGPAPEERKATQNNQAEAPRNGPPSMPSMSSSNGQPSYASHPSAQTTPLYAPPSAGAPLSRQTTGLTPLQTPSQHTPGPQYPYPHQPSQSPAVAHPQGQQYPPYGPYSASTPGARPPSHGYPYPQPSPSQYQSHLPHSMHAHQTSSLSPTPPSHHSQTPHSVRHSPLTAMPHGPQQQQYPPQLHYQHSQPSTPLGPPPLQYQRTSHHSQQDLQSPFHQRTFSGTSHAMISNSPAQHHPGIGNLVDSPSAYNRQSPHLRRTSDYLASVDRERSLSVSPKTKVPPRIPSQGSRHSSQQDIYGGSGTSARSSLQHSQHSDSTGAASMAETPGHVHAPYQASHPQSVAQPQPPPMHSQASEVAQQHPQHPSLSAQTSDTGYPAPEASLSVNLNNQQLQSHHSAIQHQPQKMEMNHLLATATSVASMDGASEATQQPPQMKQRKPQEPSIFMKPSPKPKKPAVAPAPPVQQQEQQSAPEDRSGAAEALAVQRKGQQQLAPNDAPAEAVVKEPSVPASAQMPESKKRPAESGLGAEEPPAKKGKMQRYTEKPIWARLARTNPKYKPQLDAPMGNGAPTQGRPQQMARAQQQQQQAPRQNGVHAAPAHQPQQQHHHQQTPPQPNGHPQQQQPNGASPLDQPWLQNPPLDTDLIRMRRMFGQWEKSVCWKQPSLDMEKAVADWLYHQLEALKDVSEDPNECAIEIEAKVGRIMQKRVDERIIFPINSAAVLGEAWLKKEARFESQMEKHEHKAMNEFLNATCKETMEKGRVQMSYKHLRGTDSFRALSAAGYAALPAAFRSRRLPQSREMKLRTTTDDKSGHVTARIVKFQIADLHIYNPNHDYDCRISINLEANMNRPELPPFEELVESPLDALDPKKRDIAPAPSRQKDRLSYKHLAYSIDLTRVDVDGLPAKYELELEVDAQVLRQQIALMKENKPQGFAEVVGGFLNNATYLMRQRPVAQQ